MGKGVRPLGGTVEFGETTEAAVIREFQEELAIAVKVGGPPVFMENIFVHEGHAGHEILAIFDVTFPGGLFAKETRIQFTKDDGTPVTRNGLRSTPWTYRAGCNCFRQG